MESRKKFVMMNLFPGQEYRCRCEEWTCGHVDMWTGGTNWEMKTDLYTLPHVTQLVGTCYQAQEFQLSGLF